MNVINKDVDNHLKKINLMTQCIDSINLVYTFKVPSGSKRKTLMKQGSCSLTHINYYITQLNNICTAISV